MIERILRLQQRTLTAGFVFVVAWVSWVSGSIPYLFAAQAAQDASAEHVHEKIDTYVSKTDHLYSVMALRDTQVAVLDTKLNLLLMSQGIPIPPTQGENKAHDK